jgi:hypothetical protein
VRFPKKVASCIRHTGGAVSPVQVFFYTAETPQRVRNFRSTYRLAFHFSH